MQTHNHRDKDIQHSTHRASSTNLQPQKSYTTHNHDVGSGTMHGSGHDMVLTALLGLG